MCFLLAFCEARLERCGLPQTQLQQRRLYWCFYGVSGNQVSWQVGNYWGSVLGFCCLKLQTLQSQKSHEAAWKRISSIGTASAACGHSCSLAVQALWPGVALWLCGILKAPKLLKPRRWGWPANSDIGCKLRGLQQGTRRELQRAVAEPSSFSTEIAAAFTEPWGLCRLH